MPLSITVSELLTPPRLWRFTGSVSSIVGFSCYALSPSFEHLFGKWNPLKIAIYPVLTLLIFLLMLSVNKWKRLARTFLLKAHVGFLVLMLTSLYSFFEDRSEETSTEKAYGSILSLISCGAFALMSMSWARQLELGFEVGMFNFFLGCFLMTVMKMNFKLAPVAAIFCYLLVNFGCCSNYLLKILGRERGHADIEGGSSEEEEMTMRMGRSTGTLLRTQSYRMHRGRSRGHADIESGSSGEDRGRSSGSSEYNPLQHGGPSGFSEYNPLQHGGYFLKNSSGFSEYRSSSGSSEYSPLQRGGYFGGPSPVVPGGYFGGPSPVVPGGHFPGPVQWFQVLGGRSSGSSEFSPLQHEGHFIKNSVQAIE